MRKNIKKLIVYCLLISTWMGSGEFFSLISDVRSEEKNSNEYCFKVFSRFIHISKMREDGKICKSEIHALSTHRIEVNPGDMLGDFMGNKISTCRGYLKGYGFSTFSGNRFERMNESIYVDACGPLLAYTKAFSKVQSNKNISNGAGEFETKAFSPAALNSIAGRSNVKWSSSSKLDSGSISRANTLDFRGISDDGEFVDVDLIYIGAADFDGDGIVEALINTHLTLSSEKAGSGGEVNSSFIIISKQDDNLKLVKIHAKDFICSGTEESYQCLNQKNDLWISLFGEAAISDFLRSGEK